MLPKRCDQSPKSFLKQEGMRGLTSFYSFADKSSMRICSPTNKPQAGLHAGHWGMAGKEVGTALPSCSLAPTHQILSTQNQRLTMTTKTKQKNTIRLKTGQRLAATWKDLEMIILSEVSQTEKDKHHMISLIRGIQNMTQMNLSIKQKQTRRHRELMLTKGERGGGKGVCR